MEPQSRAQPSPATYHEAASGVPHLSLSLLLQNVRSPFLLVAGTQRTACLAILRPRPSEPILKPFHWVRPLREPWQPKPREEMQTTQSPKGADVRTRGQPCVPLPAPPLPSFPGEKVLGLSLPS